MLNNNSEIEDVIPLEFFLSQNYPNPFKEKTVIKYCVPYRTKVQITVYNSEDEELEKLVDEEKNPGTYEVEFNALIDHSGESRQLSDGYYFYRLVAGDYTSDKKWFCKNHFWGRFTMKSLLQLLLFFVLRIKV